jgi:cytochrome c-type biogenesis protein CcmH
MLFWLIVALITAVLVVALTYPMFRPAPEGQGETFAAAKAIYDAQAAELERDAAAGRVTGSEFESAKAELGRRLLRAARETGPAGAAGAPVEPVARQRRGLALALSVGLPVAAMALYLSIGQPGAPSQTPAGRQAALADRKAAEAEIAALELVLQSGRGDAKGWALLVGAYKGLGESAKADDALRRAIAALKAKGQSPPPELLVPYGALLIKDAQGVVTASARATFQDVLKADPKNWAARFYLGLERAQARDKDGALAIWRPLLQELPPGSPVHAELTRRIAELTGP